MSASGDRPLAAYVRVSTGAQAASGIGLEAQRQAIEAAGLPVGSWHEDAGRSGASTANRPGLAAALAEIEAGRAGGLAVAKIDRLGRSSADVLGLVERAQREGWRLVAVDVGLDTTTISGELVATALAMAARFEYRRISERQREKHDELRRQGRPRGRPRVAPADADRMIELRRAGRSLRQIAADLSERRVPTPQGGAEWYASSVRAAIRAREQELAVQPVLRANGGRGRNGDGRRRGRGRMRA